MRFTIIVAIIILALVSFETLCSVYRNYRRKHVYNKALKHSAAIGKPLLVIGSPTSGFMGSIYPVYGCGDICTDLLGCDSCEHQLKGDIVNVLDKLPDSSYVVFESCVLECLDDLTLERALVQIKRVSAGSPFHVRISPDGITKYFAKTPLIMDGLWKRIFQQNLQEE